MKGLPGSAPPIWSSATSLPSQADTLPLQLPSQSPGAPGVLWQSTQRQRGSCLAASVPPVLLSVKGFTLSKAALGPSESQQSGGTY